MKSHRINRPTAARFTGVPLESLDAWAAAGIWTAEMRVAARSIAGA